MTKSDAEWAEWNVQVWMDNDEGLYNEAVTLRRRFDAETAARTFIDGLADLGITQTPDGAPYTYEAVLAVMEGMEIDEDE